MPVHHQKKDTTPKTPGSTQEQTAPPLLDQQVFHQHLRELARGAIRVVLEGVMCEELDALIGVGWGQSSPRRKGYRNGFYTRESFDHDKSARGRAGSARSGGSVSHAGLRTLPKLRTAGGSRADRDVRLRGKYATSVGEVAQTLMGVA